MASTFHVRLVNVEFLRPGPPQNQLLSPLTQYLWWPLLWALFWFFLLPVVLGISIRRGLGMRRNTPRTA